MTSTSLDLSSKIDALTLELLTTLNRVTRDLGIPFFLTGATARDIILEQGYGIPAGRKTQDFDLGVMVSSWEDYQRLLKTLVSTGRFTVENKIAHRLQFDGSLPVDFIAFGAVEAADGSIAWPPDYSTRLNVLGFQDAWSHSVQVRVAPSQEVRFVSPAGLAVLKLIAWRDRHHETPGKDAADLTLLLTHYAEIGNQDRLYENHQDLLEIEDFDVPMAGARMLGRDMAVIMGKRTRQVVLDILDKEADAERSDQLVIDVSYQLPNREYELALRLLESLKRGIMDRK